MNDVRVSEAMITDPICSADYLKPIDFVRPIAGTVVFSALYIGIFCAPINFLISPAAMFTAPMLITMTMIPMFMVAVIAQYMIWRRRLRKDGRAAFQRFVEVDLPMHKAFELVLAGTAAIRKSKIETFNEASGQLSLRVKGNFWITVDRKVNIVLARIDESRTRITVESTAKVTKFRDRLFRIVWGMKWYPIILSNDINLNRKLLNQLIAEIESVPNWDYHHIPDRHDSEVSELVHHQVSEEKQEESSAAA